MTTVAEAVTPQTLSRRTPRSDAPPLDPGGTSFLIISYGKGENSSVARQWLAEALEVAPVQWLTFTRFTPDAGRQLSRTLCSSRNGLRIMIVGAQFDVLQTTALALRSGALAEEVRGLASDISSLPIYCAHCRQTNCVTGEPGGRVACPGCARTLEIHPHLSAVRGSFLASDACARDVP
jgi:hypothetical protein